jgi:hypothetical protein
MQRLENMGWTDARTKLLIEGGRRAIVRPDTDQPEVWELKTNPHPWRFYFDIDQSRGYITYAYATYKQTTDANPRDVAHARTFLARLAGRTARRKRIGGAG